MKKLWLFTASITLVLISSHSFAEEPAGSEVIKAKLSVCFSDYVKNASNIGATPEEKANIQKDLIAIKARCLSSSFKKKWQKIAAKTDADPLLLVQDFDDNWKSLIVVEILTASSAKVTLGDGENKRCLRVGFDRVASQTLISSSKKCPESKAD